MPNREEKARMKEIHKRMNEIMKEYGGILSNIPVGAHEYWSLQNEFNSLKAKPDPVVEEEVYEVKEEKKEEVKTPTPPYHTPYKGPDDK